MPRASEIILCEWLFICEILSLHFKAFAILIIIKTDKQSDKQSDKHSGVTGFYSWVHLQFSWKVN